MLKKFYKYINYSKFPIIIYGNNSYNILNICTSFLKKMNIKYKFIDIMDIVEQHKPIISQLYIIYNINDQNILEKIHYKNNLIIISDIFINIKNYKVFFLNCNLNDFMITNNNLYNYNLNVYPQKKKVTIFFFIQNIFDHKIKGKNIYIENNNLIYYFLNELDKNYKFLFKSFNINITLEIIYNNFFNINIISNLYNLYNLFSLTDLNKNHLITFIIYSYKYNNKYNTIN